MVDLDRVVFECPSFLFWLGHKIYKTFDKNSELKFNEVNSEKAMQYPDALSFFKLFNDKSFVEIPGAASTLQKWNNKGFDIHFISSRPNLKPFQKATVKWLKSHNISYSKLVFGCSNKAEYCKQNNFDVMIDDTFENCENCCFLGIPSIWLVNKHNQNDQNIHVVKMHVANDWQDIDSAVQSINMMKKLNPTM